MNRKHCWKMRNCSLQAISPFPITFSKTVVDGQNEYLWSKGLSNLLLPSILFMSTKGHMQAHSASQKNQSVENAGVAFVKGASERNEFFEKINKQ